MSVLSLSFSIFIALPEERYIKKKPLIADCYGISCRQHKYGEAEKATSCFPDRLPLQRRYPNTHINIHMNIILFVCLALLFRSFIFSIFSFS